MSALPPHELISTRPPLRRPWWRQRWLMIVAGYAFAFLTGMAFARWLTSSGDWHDGFAWERALIRHLHFHLPHWLDSIVLALPWLGTNISLIPVTLAVAAWLIWRLRR